ncbi:MAG: SH3 domain-containing protein, partial [Chloroflexota bacterium]
PTTPPPTATAVPPTQPPATSTTPPPPPTTAPEPTATPITALGYGTAIPAYGGAAVVRAEPTTDSEALASIPIGDRVLVIRVVQGDAIDPVEPRWWEVEYNGVRGFVYHKLISLD